MTSGHISIGVHTDVRTSHQYAQAAQHRAGEALARVAPVRDHHIVVPVRCRAPKLSAEHAVVLRVSHRCHYLLRRAVRVRHLRLYRLVGNRIP